MSNGISVAVGDAEIVVDVNDARFKILYVETKLSFVLVKILRWHVIRRLLNDIS